MNYPKKTFLFLKINQVITLIGLAGITAVFVSGRAVNVPGLVFLGSFMLAYYFFIGWTLNGLSRHSKAAWRAAVVLSGIGVPSLLIVFAILSLKDLFRKDIEDVYFHPHQSDSALPPIYSGMSGAQRMSFVVVMLVISLTALFWSVLDVRNKNAEYKIDPSLSIQELYDLGSRCNSDGKTSCSIAVFKRILTINPSDSGATANLAIAQTRAGLHLDAIESYENYFSKGYETYDTMAYYAQSLNSVGKKEEALKWYSKALMLNPRLIDVVESMLDILIEKAEYEKAMGLISTFVQKNPSAESYLRGKKRVIEEKLPQKESQTI